MDRLLGGPKESIWKAKRIFNQNYFFNEKERRKEAEEIVEQEEDTGRDTYSIGKK